MIFNKNNEGAVELQRLVGTYFRSNDFSVIQSEIEAAEGTVRRLVGDAIFARAAACYDSVEYGTRTSTIDHRLVRAVQAPVAQLAMMRFYQQNILSHEDGGRKVKIHEGSEKMPWQWQFDRDDEALQDKYYRALDALYLFLDENLDEIPEWAAAPQRRELARCFVRDLATFQKVFPLEDSYRMFYLLVPFMQEVQERIIRPVVGDDAYARMAAGEVPEDLAEQYAAAKRCIPLYAVITAVRRMSVRILPTMIVRRFTASFQGGRGTQMDDAATQRLLQTLELEAVDAKTELQKAVTKRRQPVRPEDLLPKNSADNKYCLT